MESEKKNAFEPHTQICLHSNVFKGPLLPVLCPHRLAAVISLKSFRSVQKQSQLTAVYNIPNLFNSV